MAEWAGFTCEAIWALRDAVTLSELEWKVGVGLVSLAVVDKGAPNTAHVQGKSLACIAQASRCNRQRALDGIRRLAGETDCRLTVTIRPQSSALGDKAPHEYVIVVTPRGGVAVEDQGVAPGASHEQHLGPVEQQGVAVEDQGCCSRGPSYEDPSLRISSEDGSAHAAASATPAPLTLTAQEPKPRGRGNGKPKPSARKAKPTTPTHPGTDALKLHYVAELKRTRQADAVFQTWSRAMRAFSDLIELVGKEKAEAVITTALADPYTKRIQPWELLADANKHMGTPPRTNGRRTPEPQPAAAVGGWQPPVWKGPEA